MDQQMPDHARSDASSGNAPMQQEKLPAQPAPDDREGWKTYWKGRQQPWRTEPEINIARQQELATYYAVPPDPEKEIYPFGGAKKLGRADVEWLLATYAKSSSLEQGLDLRGADLNGEDLSGLPLIGLRGGIAFGQWKRASKKQLRAAAVQMNASLLNDAQLQCAHLNNTQLQGAHLTGAQLQDAHLAGAQLQGANLAEAQLQGAQFQWAQLQGANLDYAQLQGANLNDAQLQDVGLYDTQLADLQGIGPQLADVRWNGTDLAVIDWSQVKILGNEYRAQQKKDQNGDVKDKKQRLDEYHEAVRANRQLAVVLQGQGLNEDAAHFAYRANMLQRKVLWFQLVQPRASLWQRVQKFGEWVFSRFLDFLAGYGYRPGRTLGWYLLVIASFAIGYYTVTHLMHSQPYPLVWYEALILSISAFHGRGFFQPVQSLGDPVALLAAVEAVVGLFIEISFIATFTQRFLGK